MNDIPEVKSLLWLAEQFPAVEKPQNDIGRMQNCIHRYCMNAVNLINRQKAEIERLQHIRAELSRENEELIQRNRDLSKHIRNTDLRLMTVFEEKLKNKFFNYYDGLTESTCKSCYNGESLMMYEVADMITVCIESTVAEMTEEKE